MAIAPGGEMSGAAGIALPLDHVSVAVPTLPDAIVHFSERLGLRATASAGAPDRHARIYLHHSYLEVAGDSGADGWNVPFYFLRFGDPPALRAHLESSGLSYRVGEYVGVDGRWDDVEVLAGDVPLPMLVRRTHPPEVAAGWPPALEMAHRCTARALAAVHLVVPDLAAAVAAYVRLLGADPQGPAVNTRGGQVARFELAAGEIVLTEGMPAGIHGVVLGVASLTKAMSAVDRPGGGPSDDGVWWLDPNAAFGLRLGFIETGA